MKEFIRVPFFFFRSDKTYFLVEADAPKNAVQAHSSAKDKTAPNRDKGVSVFAMADFLDKLRRMATTRLTTERRFRMKVDSSLLILTLWTLTFVLTFVLTFIVYNQIAPAAGII